MPRKQIHSDDHVHQVLNRWIAKHGTPPTVEELREVLGVGSTRTALRYLQRLESTGRIERWSGSRGIRMIASPNPKLNTIMVPVVGEVAAGSLTLAEENIEAWVRLPEQLLRPKHDKFFMLRVRGDSMNQARIGKDRIESGDLLLVKQQPTATSGEIVVAEVDGETTVKRFQSGAGFLLLKPESDNPKHKPIMIDHEFHVQGIAVKVFKHGADLIH